MSRNSGRSRKIVYALYRRRMHQNHAECIGRYTRETDAIADRDLFNQRFPVSVFTVKAEPMDVNPGVKTYGRASQS
jgi:hypothetical protein